MFEFFFKYPRSVYARGQFALLGAWPKWMLVLLILAAAAGLAWLIRSRLAQAAPVMRGWRAWVIWGLQTLLAALLLVLLWQPAITVAELKPQQNIIAVLVDDSRSMAISEDGVTRQAQAVKALQNGVLASLNRSFQTRLYRVDDVPARIDSLKDLQPNAPSTRIGDSLKQLSEETSDLPIGAVVLLSDGDDNTGGISADAISALRARHIPVHTVGFGRERAAHDVELDDAVVAPRALADSRLAAKITLHQRGYAGAKINLTVRDVSTGQGQGPGFSHHQPGAGRQPPDRDFDVRYRWRRRQNAPNRGCSTPRRGEHGQQYLDPRGECRLRTAPHPVHRG